MILSQSSVPLALAQERFPIATVLLALSVKLKSPAIVQRQQRCIQLFAARNGDISARNRYWLLIHFLAIASNLQAIREDHKMSNSTITTQYATPAELKAILGDKWSVCRNTPENRERYGRCITRQQYVSATKSALAGRATNSTNTR